MFSLQHQKEKGGRAVKNRYDKLFTVKIQKLRGIPKGARHNTKEWKDQTEAERAGDKFVVVYAKSTVAPRLYSMAKNAETSGHAQTFLGENVKFHQLPSSMTPEQITAMRSIGKRHEAFQQYLTILTLHGLSSPLRPITVLYIDADEEDDEIREDQITVWEYLTQKKIPANTKGCADVQLFHGLFQIDGVFVTQIPNKYRLQAEHWLHSCLPDYKDEYVDLNFEDPRVEQSLITPADVQGYWDNMSKAWSAAAVQDAENAMFSEKLGRWFTVHDMPKDSGPKQDWLEVEIVNLDGLPNDRPSPITAEFKFGRDDQTLNTLKEAEGDEGTDEEQNEVPDESHLPSDDNEVAESAESAPDQVKKTDGADAGEATQDEQDTATGTTKPDDNEEEEQVTAGVAKQATAGETA
jgi:hypothetical protein